MVWTWKKLKIKRWRIKKRPSKEIVIQYRNSTVDIRTEDDEKYYTNLL
jgi:hypothetical protein